MRRGQLSAKADLWARLAGLITWVAAATGCAVNRPVDIPSLASTPLPTYGLGDAYQFSDDSNDTVTAVDGDVVRWRGKDGTFVTSRDVLAPRLSWSNGAVQGQRRIDGDPSRLFPLAPAKSVAFSATRSVHAQSGGSQVIVREDWGCSVMGAARVSTRAGTFDTWRVDCTIHETPAAPGKALIERTVYYAPAIGFYVRTDEAVGDVPFRVTELSSYTSSDPLLANTALRQRSYALQRALETQLSGSEARWSDVTTGEAGVLTLLNTMRSERYGWCRDFAESIQSSGRTYSLHGTGCRDSQKIWDIVAMAPGKAGSD